MKKVEEESRENFQLITLFMYSHPSIKKLIKEHFPLAENA